MRRSFLFLQGPCTPFFSRLADQLRRDGHAIHRVHFCAGDVAYWAGGKACWFHGDMTALRDFLDEKYRSWGITDQILFGDRRPVHRPAVEHGEACGVRTHVFEEGYFRPWWITLEREGVNGHSLLPRDPDWFWEAGDALPEPPSPEAFDSPFFKRATHDVLYHLAGLANPFIFPRYRTHAGVTAPVEYGGYLLRFAWLGVIRRRERQRARAIAEAGVPYFVLPLQLNSDAQIRDHSRFDHMGEVIEYVLESFAKYAPGDSRIIIKNHPLDMGLMNYARMIDVYERRFALTGRVDYLEDGNLALLMSKAQGVVTVNSTAGLQALEQGTPTVTLSDPIYNLPGLTAQAKLDDFWYEPPVPHQELFARFRRVVLYATQINGGFYSREAIKFAVANASRVLTEAQSPLEKLMACVRS